MFMNVPSFAVVRIQMPINWSAEIGHPAAKTKNTTMNGIKSNSLQIHEAFGWNSFAHCIGNLRGSPKRKDTVNTSHCSRTLLTVTFGTRHRSRFSIASYLIGCDPRGLWRRAYH